MKRFMKKSFWRAAIMTCGAMSLAACGNKETKETLDKTGDLEKQEQFADANTVLVNALQAREAKLRDEAGNPTDSAAVDALKKKIAADSEILKMERAWVGLYLHWNRTDMAASVYSDILSGDPDDSSMNDFLRDPDQDIRKRAVEVLGLAADPKSANLDKTINTLVTATKDSDATVRAAAIDALGATKDPRVFQPVVDALKDSDWNVRFEVVDALSQLHDERVIAPLLDAAGDSDKSVRGSAHDNLEGIASAEKPFAKADDFAGRLNDSNPDIEMTAAECLGLLRDPRAVPVLMKLIASTDPEVKLNAVKGLGEAGDRSALPMLRQLLTDPDLNMRGWSIIGLGKLKDEDSLMDLEHIATDETQPNSIRQAAAASVEEIRSTLPQMITP
jgi:HEAT repeat protein